VLAEGVALGEFACEKEGPTGSSNDWINKAGSISFYSVFALTVSLLRCRTITSSFATYLGIRRFLLFLPLRTSKESRGWRLGGRGTRARLIATGGSR
jgi:hypothetical protein